MIVGNSNKFKSHVEEMRKLNIV